MVQRYSIEGEDWTVERGEITEGGIYPSPMHCLFFFITAFFFCLLWNDNGQNSMGKIK